MSLSLFLSLVERERSHMVPNLVNMVDGSPLGWNVREKVHGLSSCVSGCIVMVPEEPPQLTSRVFALPGINNVWYAVVYIPSCIHCPPII